MTINIENFDVFCMAVEVFPETVTWLQSLMPEEGQVAETPVVSLFKARGRLKALWNLHNSRMCSSEAGEEKGVVSY